MLYDNECGYIKCMLSCVCAVQSKGGVLVYSLLYLAVYEGILSVGLTVQQQRRTIDNSRDDMVCSVQCPQKYRGGALNKVQILLLEQGGVNHVDSVHRGSSDSQHAPLTYFCMTACTAYSSYQNVHPCGLARNGSGVIIMYCFSHSQHPHIQMDRGVVLP